ncbi:RNA-binding ATPase activator esf2 [Microbotryomycetes sp. JL201]|nr:RNA-binding ATPase activator esf2 [Microbotryomycetes sp. JL201]
MAPPRQHADNASKKRKRAVDKDDSDVSARMPQVGDDERFKFLAEDLQDSDERGSSDDGQESGSSAADKAVPGSKGGPSEFKTTLPAHLLPASSNKQKTTPGLVYLSRIPPGMGPPKVKHLLSAYGDVGRIYLARADKDSAATVNPKGKKRQREKHQEHRFSEGWVEFLDKRVARSVAEMLNANTIGAIQRREGLLVGSSSVSLRTGGKKGTRWRDDVWTMKYLPRFRWDMLSEQVALERATQDSVMRFHLQQSKKEQESYLSAVEQARVARKIEEKRATQKKAKGQTTDGEEARVVKKPKNENDAQSKTRTYRQREVVKTSSEGPARTGGTKKDLDDVLGKLF